MSGGAGSNQNTTNAQQNSLPAWLTPSYQGALGQGTNLLGTMTGATGAAPGLTSSGLSSVGLVNPNSIGAADNSLSQTLHGQYMQPADASFLGANPAIASEASGSLMNPNANPYLSGMYTEGLQGIQNNLDSQFGAAGRNVLGSAPVQADQASVLANSLLGGQYATNLNATQNAQGLVSNNYNSGIGAMNTAAGIAPGVTSGLYTPGMTQLSAGASAYQPLSFYSSLLNTLAAHYGQQSGGTSTDNSSTMGPIQTIGGILGLI